MISKLKKILDVKVSTYCNSVNDLKKYELAFSVWHYFHKNQKRDTWEDYFTHPIEVTLLLINYFESEIKLDDIIISLLHDTLEDTTLKKDSIENLFWKFVANCVEELSKPDKITFLTLAEKKELNLITDRNIYNQVYIKEVLKKLRERRDIEYYWAIKNWNKSSVRVKICDRLHNLSTLPKTNIKKIEKNIKTTREYFLNWMIKNKKVNNEIEKYLKKLEKFQK